MKKEVTNKPRVDKINIGTGYSAEEGGFAPAEMEAFEVAAHFGTNMEKGLTKQQIRRTRMEKGFNTLQAEYDTSFISSLKKQISGICMPLMVVSLLIAAAFVEGTEIYTPMAAVLVAIMFLCAAIDRYSASVLNKSLRDNAMRSTVLRDGKLVSVSSVSLVPGDIIELENGSIVPADARISEANHLMVLETPVTGVKESTVKDAEYIAEEEGRGSYNMVYAGTIVTSGRARAIVCRTGNDCVLYRKAGSAEKQLPAMYHKAIKNSGIFTLCVAALSFITVIAGLFLGRPLVDVYMLGASATLCCMQSAAVSLGFGGFAAGVRRMYKNGAVLRRFSAVDTLCLTDSVLCDKDVAFPMSELRPKRVFINKSYHAVNAESRDNIRKVLTYALLCSDLRRSNSRSGLGEGFAGMPADVSLARECDRIGINIDDFRNEYFRIEAEYTKNGEIKQALYLHNDSNLLILRGKPEEILPLCAGYVANGTNNRFDDYSMRRMQQAAKEMGEASQHVIAVASAVCDCDSLRTSAVAYRRLVLNGFIGLYTSLKLDSASAVYKCAAGGIETVMLSGEAYVTAVSMAKNAGIIQSEKQVMAAEQLKFADRGLYIADSESYKLYLHLNEEEWLDVMRIRRDAGHTVAITAESTDRIPMMHEADATFVPAFTAAETVKYAADVLLYKSGLKTVETALRASRMIYRRIVGAIRQFCIGAVAVLVCALAAVIFELESPLRLQDIIIGGTAFNFVFAAAAAFSPDHRKLLEDEVDYKSKHYGLPFAALYGASCGLCLLAVEAFLARLGGSAASNSAVMLSSFALLMFLGLLFGPEQKHFYRSSAFKSYTVPLGAVIVVVAVTLLVLVPQLAQPLGFRVPGYKQWLTAVLLPIGAFALFQCALMVTELVAEYRKNKQIKKG